MARAVNTVVDSLDFYVETRDLPSAVLSVTATATSTQNGADVSNTGSGGLFYVSFTSVQATATVRLSWQAKDPISQQYITIATLSLDGISTTNTVGGIPLNSVYIYPGAITPTGGSNVTVSAVPLPRVFRVQASITAAASGGGPGLSMNVGMTRLGAI